MEKVHQIFDFGRLENISERRHRCAAIVNLMLDFLLAEPLADGAQIRSKIPTSAIYAMAMLTTFLMKERGSRLFAFARVGANNRSRRLRRAARKSCDKSHERDCSNDASGYLRRSRQRIKCLSVVIDRGNRTVFE
jgi:hypothetical protein